LIRVLAGGFDDAAGGGIDHGGHAAGLTIQGIFLGHGWQGPCDESTKKPFYTKKTGQISGKTGVLVDLKGTKHQNIASIAVR